MRKKLDTRFPAARIKKIMQTDEDVGKIASAVPVLVSKALELFLQDLCDKTYGITLQRGMKTMSSQHLKQCVQSCNHYDFLRELVSKVPDLGSGDAASGDGRLTQKRRTADEEEIEEQLKRPRVESAPAPAYNASSSTNASSSSGTGRGRGRPRGSGRGRRARGGGAERDNIPHYEEDLGISPAAHNNNHEVQPSTVLSDSPKETETIGPVHNFDLNVDFNENNASSGPVRPMDPTGPQQSVTVQDAQEEYLGWSVEDMKKKMAVDPVQFALTRQRVDDDEEEEDDYDNE